MDERKGDKTAQVVSRAFAYAWDALSLYPKSMEVQILRPAASSRIMGKSIQRWESAFSFKGKQARLGGRGEERV